MLLQPWNSPGKNTPGSNGKGRGKTALPRGSGSEKDTRDYETKKKKKTKGKK